MTFIVSAVAKLASADMFEMYIFSFAILPLEMSFLAARLVICAELALGLLLLLNTRSKFPLYAAAAMLGGFSLFLIWLLAKGESGNCHCFGELVNFSPAQSLLKNGVMGAMLAVAWRAKPYKIGRPWLWNSLLAVAAIATVFIVSPPDNWFYEGYAQHSFDQRQFDSAIESGLLPPSLAEGEKTLCFFSLKCEFCQMTATKLGGLRREGKFTEGELISVFGRNPEDKQKCGELLTCAPADDAHLEMVGDGLAQQFFRERKLDCTTWCNVDPGTLIRITSGRFPVVAIMRDGKLVAEYGYRDLH